MNAVVRRYSVWLARCEVPELSVRAVSGFLTPVCDRHARGWRNRTEVSIPGRHFLEEDSPVAIGRAVGGRRAAPAHHRSHATVRPPWVSNVQGPVRGPQDGPRSATEEGGATPRSP